VLPVAHNSGLFWGRKTLMIHSGNITLSFLPPIPPGLDRKVFQAEVERVIAAEAARLLQAADAKQ
jgi:1-acyl-sn-glycerol-3-phosphate acyltransferase